MGTYQRGNSVDVIIKDFAPDLELDSPGIILDAQGAIPTIKGYQAQNSALPHVYAPLTETPLGSTVGTYSDNTIQHWAGGAGHLWRMLGTMDDPGSVWTQADSQGITPFNATAWNFAQFNDDLIAVGGTGVVPQVAAGQNGIFNTLGGSPPTGATLVLAVNGQVMMFKGNTWYVSALGSDSSWGASTQTQAGSAPITDLPGNIVAAQALFRNVVAFKNRGIWFGSYVGGASIWSFQFIDDVNGTWGQGCTMLFPGGVAFFGLDDFYTCTGYTPQRIGNNIKEWFFDIADPAEFPRMLSRYDPYHAIGYWHFVSKNPPIAHTPDRFVAYNFRSGRWGPGYLSTPDVPVPNFHFGNPTDINGFYFDTSNILQTFRGNPGPMRILTGYMGETGKHTQLMRVRPKYSYHPTTQTLQSFHVGALGQQDIAGPAGVEGNNDWFYLRQTDRYHRIQLSVVSSTTQPSPSTLQVGAELSGFSFEFREGGDR